LVYSSFPSPLKKALLTLQEAKDKNKNILSFNDILNKNREQEFFEIKQMLKTAIKQDQITPFAQPIVNGKQQVIKYELLMRIVTKDKVIPPYFLDFAKKAKLYTQISSIMIDKCFEFIKSTDILCSINIDMQDITNEDIVNKLRYYIQTIKKPVVFEILESESFQNYKELHKFIEEFKGYGVKIAIDDFGSGYSSYSEILSLKPDYIKIDGSLIKNITSSKDSLIVIDSIIFLTNMMGIVSVAEFVENENIFKKLRALGINEFQGYYFDKPKPLNEL
jgi:EAL domain-containing protein (putative c-di-GMP-specific phosphodiesterase class I)